MYGTSGWHSNNRTTGSGNEPTAIRVQICKLIERFAGHKERYGPSGPAAADGVSTVLSRSPFAAISRSLAGALPDLTQQFSQPSATRRRRADSLSAAE
jgi:hypothetical protein